MTGFFGLGDASRPVPVGNLSEIVEVVEVDVVNFGGRRVDVPGKSEIDQNRGAAGRLRMATVKASRVRMAPGAAVAQTMMSNSARW